MRWSGIVKMSWLLVTLAVLTSSAMAQTKQSNEKKSDQTTSQPKQQVKKSERSSTPKGAAEKGAAKKGGISIAKGNKFPKPSVTLDPGTIGNHFFPIAPGSYWRTQTVKALYDLQNKLVSADTLLAKETVLTNSAGSIQGLPLIKCESISFKPGMDEARGYREEVQYYVDDSLIMATFNNSVQHGENRALLVNPLKVGFKWAEKHGDTVMTEIVSVNEPVETVAGKWDNAVVTTTRMGYGELSKYFVPGVGIAKMVFRGPGANGQGTLVVTTDLLEVKHGNGHLEGETERIDPTMMESTPQKK
jgi:hypothetical protein